ncbi:MAG TPA: hypothetical protein VE990_14250 [Acidimicrobiales bacterium]|nr:hypothetical protein [Acidimicrobiales bacterium]
MSRRLGELDPDEREAVVAAVHAEAELANWHQLSNGAKGTFYRQWEDRFDLSHSTIKDQIMKGFDKAQHIPPSGEAAVHDSLRRALEGRVPYVGSKVRHPGWRREVDLVLGYSPRFLTHIAELEPATRWELGLQQALLYKSVYFQLGGLQALPTLILFGDVTAERWGQIETVCTDNRVFLTSHQLRVDDRPRPGLTALLGA